MVYAKKILETVEAVELVAVVVVVAYKHIAAV